MHFPKRYFTTAFFFECCRSSSGQARSPRPQLGGTIRIRPSRHGESLTSLAGRDLVTLPRDGRFHNRMMLVTSDSCALGLSSRGRHPPPPVPTEGSDSCGTCETRCRFLPFDSSRYESSGLAQGRNDIGFLVSIRNFYFEFRNVSVPLRIACPPQPSFGEGGAISQDSLLSRRLIRPLAEVTFSGHRESNILQQPNS